MHIPAKYHKTTLLAIMFICSVVFLSSTRTGASEPDAISGETIVITEHKKTTRVKPLIKDFIGINGHFHFKPDLYGQVSRLVRNYHNINWDVEKPGNTITLPVCANKVNWEKDVYGPWKAKGFEIDICIQFSGFAPPEPNYQSFWTGQEDWVYEYGKAISSYFGPSGDKKLCTSMEIGNEPGSRFDSTLFKSIFKKMAQGIRDGDPKVKILTPTVHAGKGNDYYHDLNSIYKDKDVLPLYDIINLHTYADIPASSPGKSPWNRTWPEDPATGYLKVVDEAIEWRDKNAPDKHIWITEFGYDACTPDVMPKRTGWALTLDWQGVSDLQQAQYIVRSFFLFAERDIERAYIYYYNDNDEPGVHASAGLTRHFQPKMSFWAVKQLFDLLGEYRFVRIVQRYDKKAKLPVYVYEFGHGESPDKKIWAIWSPTGIESHRKEGYTPESFTVNLKNTPGRPVHVVPMAISPSMEEESKTAWKTKGNSIELLVSESPAYIIFEPDNQ
jgi:hypothetical protein